MSDNNKKIPNPGTPDAVDLGCTCRIWDGEVRRNETWPDWIVQGCMIHDPNLNDGDTNE